jgi:formylglycine-generating enzyme required for sulfatase activity
MGKVDPMNVFIGIITAPIVAGAAYMMANPYTYTITEKEFFRTKNSSRITFWIYAQSNNFGIPAEKRPKGTVPIEMHWCPPGQVRTLGGGKIEISRGFWISIYPVTTRVFNLINGNLETLEDRTPAHSSISGIERFLSRLSKADPNPTGSFRLPSEHEWEYAAMSGGMNLPELSDDDRHDLNFVNLQKEWDEADRFSSGKRPARQQQQVDPRFEPWVRYGPVNEISWNASNSGNSVHPVGQKRPNPLGIYDMLGNVWEWCDNASAPPGNRHVTKYRHICRGGSWATPPGEISYQAKKKFDEGRASPEVGFRIVWQERPTV